LAGISAIAAWQPEYSEVIVAENLFGDIITELAAIIQGSLGIAAGGKSTSKTSTFEPVDGGAPKYAGPNVINPLPAFLDTEDPCRKPDAARSDLAAPIACQGDRSHEL
jgi:3-isopropylmalate dehydrogenase